MAGVGKLPSSCHNMRGGETNALCLVVVLILFAVCVCVYFIDSVCHISLQTACHMVLEFLVFGNVGLIVFVTLPAHHTATLMSCNSTLFTSLRLLSSSVVLFYVLQGH
jgi:hypothetical protein